MSTNAPHTKHSQLLSVSTDRRNEGVSRVWDEKYNRYVADEHGRVLEFAMPYDAESWVRGELGS